MTTATAQKAPTEAEIRALIADRDRRYPSESLQAGLESALESAFDVIGYVTLDEQGEYEFGEAFLSDTWADLRPSEACRLAELIGEAKGRAENAAREAIVREVVEAGLAFAAEYPDAPRATS